ncbi:MAG: NADP-dependent oxidoreductase [Microthrixaceae bacterium]
MAERIEGPPTTRRRVLLRRRPEGLLADDDVEVVTEAVPELADGEALLDNEVIGIDASVRSWLGDGSGYLPPVELGEVVRCSTVGRVVASRCDRYGIGDIVTTLGGWEDSSVIRDDFFSTWVSEPDPDYDPEAFLALYGSTGCTAYIGMMEVGKVTGDDTVVVSAAAGATGSAAAQIAKIAGARVIGIAGGEEKCRWLTEEVGLDGAIDHRHDDVAAKLRELAPKRVDLFFDNVGGELLDAVLGRLALHARVVLCGHIASYLDDADQPAVGPSNYVQLIQQRATMTGFLAFDEVPRFPEIGERLRAWHTAGDIVVRTQRFEGLERGVDALNAMFTGSNIGKIVIIP